MRRIENLDLLIAASALPGAIGPFPTRTPGAPLSLLLPRFFGRWFAARRPTALLESPTNA